MRTVAVLHLDFHYCIDGFCGKITPLTGHHRLVWFPQLKAYMSSTVAHFKLSATVLSLDAVPEAHIGGGDKPCGCIVRLPALFTAETISELWKHAVAQSPPWMLPRKQWEEVTRMSIFHSHFVSPSHVSVLGGSTQSDPAHFL